MDRKIVGSPHDRVYLSDETYTVTTEAVTPSGDVRYRAVSPKHTFEYMLYEKDIVAAPHAHSNAAHAAVILDMRERKRKNG